MTSNSSSQHIFQHTKVLKINVDSISFTERYSGLPKISDPETFENLKQAAKIISSTDDLVGFPTETVYGLGGSAINDRSVKNIFKAKNRPSDNPLIVHISSLDQLERLIKANTNTHRTEYPSIYKALIARFWPGPVSILIPIDTDLKDSSDPYVLSKYVTNNLDTVAVRFPSDPVARALIALSDTPIAAPSANTSTKPSPTMAEHVFHDLQGKIPLILDGGNCNIGLESTVVNGLVDPPTMLRPGGLSVNQIKEIPGFEQLVTELTAKKSSEPVRTPGMKYKHYSPNADVLLLVLKSGKLSNCKEYEEAVAGSKRVGVMSEVPVEQKENVVIRPLGSSVEEIQFNMFRLLREMDSMGIDSIVVVLREKTLQGDGLAVANRIEKAAGRKVVV